MALTSGTRLGHYEIGALIGAGGMGEVYQARDPRLDRSVAIKVLQIGLAAEPAARARFEREARTIAGLNHPHIATLHDVGRQDQTDFLVMELVEGESLAAALTRGPLPIERALTCAIEIAGALDQAHRHGVVHRDLKPANIMLTRSGVKLLDFGLAKLWGGGGAPVAVTGTEVSSVGEILGTLQYMAPEQLEGAEADARTDIFAFGAVLYEMVTGKPAFEGSSRASLMGAILRDTPAPVSSVQRVAPAALDRVIATCLAKDPDDRWQSVRDAGRELKWIAGGSSATSGVSAMIQASRGSKRPAPIVVTTAIALVVGLVGAAGAWALKPGARAEDRPAIARLAITLPAGHQIGDQQSPPLALSPDGQTLVYSSLHDGTVQLYVRSLDATDARPLIGTEGASMPFFSPDGKSVGFFADGNLKRVSLTGSAPQTICPASVGVGGTWAPDDTIYFVPFNMAGLWKVAASGGTPQPATTLNRADGEVSHRLPHILPGGKALLFTVWTGPGSDERHVHILHLDSGERHLLLRGASTGLYVASGHILYSRDDAMMAVRFDVATGQLTGQPVALGERVLDDEGAHFTVSDTGTLVYVPVGARRFERRLVWVTPPGHVEPLAAPARPYTDPMISPDGRFAVFTNIGPVETLWIHDLTRGTQTSLTTTALGTSQAGTWTPDGKRIVYRGTRLGFRNVFWKAADGSDDEKRLTTNEVMQTPTSAANGTVAIVETAQGTGADIWTLALDSSTPQVFLKTPAAENNARFSPDGRWIAYTSIDAGSRDVYVRPFPGPGGRLPVSNNGGWEPVWSRDGHELYFRRGDAMLSVRITMAPTLTASAPRVLFEGNYLRSDTGGAGYDVAADGRFLMIQPVEPEVPATSFNVVLNWFDELKRRVPAGKP